MPVALLVLSASSVYAELPGRLADAFNTVRWVAYSPTGSSSDLGPADAKDADRKRGEVKKDLAVLKKAGFMGIVTYGSDGLKAEIPKLARESGIPHVIMGVYDPKRAEEIANAKAAADFVDGYCVGNEGIGSRYTLDELLPVMKDLREWSGKPVTTSEQIEKYFDHKVPGLVEAGDWLFPNVHPWFHRQTTEPAASKWTKEQVDKLKTTVRERGMNAKVVICKEVGFPTSGDDENRVSEDLQASYYVDLAKLKVPFVYFEAFDQEWKRHLPIEPHWGLFTKDRSPKKVVATVVAREANRSPVSIRFTKLEAGKKLRCKLGSDGGIIEIAGTTVGIDENTTLLFFVFPVDPGVYGWFLQLGNNAVRLNPDGAWSARGQVGNRLYPPPNGMKIHIMVRAVNTATAAQLIKEEQSHPDSPIADSDLPKASAIGEIRDIILDVEE
jgi:exo-beta-1,3-glucanase (GH17 family)